MNDFKALKARNDRLSLWIPGMFLPECLERDIVAVEDIAFGLADVRDALRKTATRTQIALAVTGILPEVPTIPRRRVARLEMIIGNP